MTWQSWIINSTYWIQFIVIFSRVFFGTAPCSSWPSCRSPPTPWWTRTRRGWRRRRPSSLSPYSTTCEASSACCPGKTNSSAANIRWLPCLDNGSSLCRLHPSVQAHIDIWACSKQHRINNPQLHQLLVPRHRLVTQDGRVSWYLRKLHWLLTAVHVVLITKLITT